METLGVCVLFFSLLCVSSYRDRTVDPGLRYAYTIVMDSKEGAPSCFATGYVDGESFVAHSNGKTHRIGSWLLEHSLKDEEQSFSTQCNDMGNELRNMMNNSKVAGIKTLQLDVGCKSTFGRKYMYNGEDVRPYTLNGTSNPTCRSKLQLYRALVAAAAKFPHLEVERKIMRRQDMAKLRCIARDFYPADLELQWWRESDGRFNIIADSDIRDSLPSGDGVYQRHVDITVNIGDESLYTCRVRGVATKRELEIIKWRGSAKKSDDSFLLIVLFLPIIIVSGILILVIVIRRKNKSSRPRSSLRKHRRTVNRRPSYRVNRHTEPPCQAPITIWIKADDVLADDLRTAA
uniref:Membrane protein m144 n=1 Tax=Mastomys natalensis cytomegalovirus 1 TaxID=2973541 RepID=A0A9Y1N5Q2_9BETA|nr:membrane protein m144 [Mastomys natalensis cytomegalovirus 1]WEG68993.1 membrane protein m144 [Mastomys natalensis cytomegalovirus 1]WEG71221.1 membrane protein m144 [Mastomys natalensis cytomegalovirus 1]